MEEQEIYEYNHKNSFENYVAKLTAKRGYKVSGIQEGVSLSKNTWYKKLREPNKFTVEEVVRLSELLTVEPSDVFKRVLKCVKEKKL